MILVGKAQPGKSGKPIERYLLQFMAVFNKHSKFVYPWSFALTDPVSERLRTELPSWLLLPEVPIAKWGFRIADFRRSESTAGIGCPAEWETLCIEEQRGITAHDGKKLPIRVWFLVDAVHRPEEGQLLLRKLRPLFPDTYKQHGQNSFGVYAGDPTWS